MIMWDEIYRLDWSKTIDLPYSMPLKAILLLKLVNIYLVVSSLQNSIYLRENNIELCENEILSKALCCNVRTKSKFIALSEYFNVEQL